MKTRQQQQQNQPPLPPLICNWYKKHKQIVNTWSDIILFQELHAMLMHFFYAWTQTTVYHNVDFISRD